MHIPRIAIDNYRFTILAFVILTIAGVNSYLFMPRTENPEMNIPGATVYIVYPGASPSDLEEQVAIPIEEAINELDDVKDIKTTLIDGLAIISVEFYFGNDALKKHDEVVRQVNSVKGKLPEEIFSIETFRWSSTDVIMLQLALVSDSAEYKELETKGELLKKNLEKINGIRKVELRAVPEQEVRISMDFEKMAQMNISTDHIINALKSNNANIPGGNIEISGKSFGIKTSGSYSNLNEIRNTVINSYMGQLIYLKDVADISYKYEDQRYIARFNGKKAIWLSVQQKEGLNIFKLFKEIDPLVEKFSKHLDDKTKLEIVFNQKDEVNQRINGFQKNLLQGIILVGIVVLLALGLKSSFVVIIAIPLSIIMGLFVVDISGFGLQQISIAGLVVALGLLVDNSIVMIENINRFIEKGYSPREAAIKGASEIGWPIVSATITTVLAFIPIIMMPDKAGFFIRSLPVTIIATLTFSLFIALTLVPLISSKIFKPKDELSKKSANITWVTKGLNKFIEGPYRRILNYAFGHKILLICISVIILGFSLFVAKNYMAISFFPKAEKPQFLIRAELAEDANLNKTNEIAQYIEEEIQKIEEVKYFATNIGNGNPRIYYNYWPKSYVKNYTEILVQLKEYNPLGFEKLIDSLRSQFEMFPGAKITIKEFEQGTPIAAPIEIMISGKDFSVLKNIADHFESELKKQKGAVNINNELSKDRTDLYFNINKDKANMLGVPIHEIDKTIRIAVNGATVSKYRDKDGKEFNIVLRMDYNDKIKVEDFDKIYVKSFTGKMIPIRQLADIEFKKAANSISRTQLERTAKIYADLDKDANLDEIMAPIIQKLEEYNFPDGYSYKIGGELESRNETFGGMAVALVIAVIAIFAVLVLQFKSVVQPIIIFIALPFALIGMIWALVATGNSFSFTAFIGLISLVGIVINNSIILVDYTNRLRLEGMDKNKALQTSGETRFTPIILTTLTTIGGIVPLTIGGGSLWAPLGWTIIGGLMVSTILTLVMVPVFYSILVRENIVE